MRTWKCTLCRGTLIVDGLCGGCGVEVAAMPTEGEVESRNRGNYSAADVAAIKKKLKTGSVGGIGNGGDGGGDASDRAYHGGQFSRGEW